MRIEALLHGALVAAATLTVTPGVAEAQAPLFLVDQETRVRSVAFRVSDGGTLDEDRLEAATALDGPGALAGLRSVFAILPGFAPPRLELFSPLVLQKDLVRLRRLYRQAGFPRAALDYEVTLDTADNVVDVTFLIEEGDPTTLGSLTIADADGGPPEASLPEELAREWSEADMMPGQPGRVRFGRSEAAALEARIAGWFRERGYPWAEAHVQSADTTPGAVPVSVVVRPGARARVDEIRVEGTQRLNRNTVLREFPLKPGDWYDERRVTDGQSELFGLDIVRRALAGVLDEQPRDSTVTLQIRVEEGNPRLLTGRAGFGSEIGVAGEAKWLHRDFAGGARTLTLSGIAETGWLALGRVPSRTYGLSATVQQPYLGHRRLSGSVGPFAAVTDGITESSRRLGLDAAVVYRAGLFRSLALQYQLSYRTVDDALSLRPVRQLVEGNGGTEAPSFGKSTVKLVGSWGALDDARTPGSGFLVQPSVEVTTPGSGVEFVRLGVEALTARPLGARSTLLLRASAGRLVPFGQSRPENRDLMPNAFLGLRDVTFTAGGTRDVRGWSAHLLGPKMPDIEFGPDSVAFAAGYVPVGGLARATGSVELVLPAPLLGRAHRTFAFLDSGRVWSPGERYDAPDPELDQDGWFHAIGAGVQLATPVGPIRVGAGYKLNPSTIDLLSAQAVLEALVEGRPLSSLPKDQLRRWHFHVSLGVAL